MNRFDQAVKECVVPTDDEAITPPRVREIHREGLAALKAGRGERFWTFQAQPAAAR